MKDMTTCLFRRLWKAKLGQHPARRRPQRAGRGLGAAGPGNTAEPARPDRGKEPMRGVLTVRRDGGHCNGL